MTAVDPRVGEIENRLNAASSGAWTASHEKFGSAVTAGRTRFGPHVVAQVRTISNAEFIAHSPSDVAYLLAELRKRDEALARVEAACDRVINNEDGHKPPGPPHPTQQQATAIRIRAAVTGDGA